MTTLKIKWKSRKSTDKASSDLNLETTETKNDKGVKSSDHRNAQVIASFITKQRSKRGNKTAPKPGVESPKGISYRSPPGNKDQKVTGKIFQQGASQDASKVRKTNPNTGRHVKGKRVVKLKLCKGNSTNRVSKIPGNRTQSKPSAKLQQNGCDLAEEVKKPRKKKKKTRDQSNEDEISKLRKRVKYLLTRMKLEQNLIDAYSGEGWKGQSREKIRPEKELQRARAQILCFQHGIRDAIRHLDSLGLEGTMKEYIFDSQGRVRYEHIFCAKCRCNDIGHNNDIILCDGFCDRAFHQQCLVPPLKTDEIPPEDEGWLCPVCECKLDCLNVVNAYVGTSYCIEDHWQNIFSEAVASSSNEHVPAANAEDWPSDDPEDDDYNPYQNSKIVDAKKDSEASNSVMISSSSDEEGDSDSDLNTDDENETGDRRASLLAELAGIMENGIDEIRSKCRNDLRKAAEADEDDVVLVDGKRQRKEVDYQKLHDEMFGKGVSSDEVSEDEEWGPRRCPKKPKQSKETHTPNGGPFPTDPESTPLMPEKKRTHLPPAAVEKLQAVYNENPLPSKACKEGLSRQLGLTFRRVHVWFKNVRATALKKGLAQPTKFRTKHGIKSMKPSTEGKSQQEKYKIPVPKRRKIAKRDSWLTVMDMLSEAQLRVDMLKSSLQDSLTDAGGMQLMYVPVAELKER